MAIPVKRKPRKCSRCGGRVATILYGMPIPGPKLDADVEAGRIVLGGCCPPLIGGPVWQCVDCGADFCRESEAAEAEGWDG